MSFRSPRPAAELREAIDRAIAGPIECTFPTADEARAWVYRLHNYIRRHAPEAAQLMVRRRGATVYVGVPQITINDRAT